MLIRDATEKDLSSIVEIENCISSPWSRTQIAAELKYSAAIVLISTCNKGETATGWCSLRYVIPEAELLKIAVHPKYRRTGLGELLLNKALKKVSFLGCGFLFLEVRAKNLPARNLYRKLGFEEYGMRKSYYSQPADDAILYRRDIVSATNK